jgi:Fe-Mn family superoxide dismutase
VGRHNVESVLASLAAMPDAIQAAVRNNAGGHDQPLLDDHEPDGGGEPEGDRAAIDDLWARPRLKIVINDGGVSAGSGWTWLVTTAPVLPSSRRRTRQPAARSDEPLRIDVWEHALPQLPEPSP